jgi:uncharacterized protein YndB with AHSA1/START domain
MQPVRLTRVLPAAVQRVWRALTVEAELAAWFWPAELETVATAEPRLGGCYRIQSTPAAMAVAGAYTCVEPPCLLAFTWRWDGDPTETVVTVRLRPTGAGTELAVAHDGFSDREDWDRHHTGWSHCLDRLPVWLDATRHIEPTPHIDTTPHTEPG